ncbi:protein KRI1 homolog isoform X2 [Andrena cerasifolii]|uniref:protein KRI1 homolog isoform X2 n=1 Tax=Andrena cerasifolii TaxID=2819439 RepID=UPI004037A9E7
MLTLFNVNNSDSDEELKVNTDYAKSYDNWRQKEELNKLRTKYGDISGNGTSDQDSDTASSSEEEEEEEEDGGNLTEQFDKDFYTTLACLKNKNPKIYNQDVTFFDNTNKAQELYDARKQQKPTEKCKKEEAVFLRDYERKMIIEREGRYSDSEDESELKKNNEETKKVTYAQEQKQLKESFKLRAFNDKGGGEEGGEEEEEDEDDTELLKPKPKSDSEAQKEEAAYKEWLKGQESRLNDKEQEELKPLRDYWSNPDLEANEKFLRDYVLDDKYLDKEYSSGGLDDTRVVHDSDENLSEDEKNIERQEEFEHKYNFRFEEPDQEFIKRYPRTMENSIRRKDTRRSEKRVEVKQRKEEEKLRQREELKQLKALKRKEIEEKIEKLKEITGNDDVKFNDIDLDGDFDPGEYDRKMREMFNDDYYGAPEDDAKPKFPDIDEELEIEDTWDNYDPSTENYDTKDEGYEGPHCEDPEFNMDADYDASKSARSEIDGVKGRKRRKKSKFAELIAKEKPKFDPRQYKCYEEYFDKYYSLDYEDMIGDVPCRFKYRKVVPNDYGLSVEEILMADDKELNKWCSLKKALQYKPEHAELNDVQMFKQKAKNEALKQKILGSLYSNQEDEEDPVAVKKKKKRHGEPTNNKELDANDVKITSDAAATSTVSKKISSKTEKRKQPEDQCEQSSKKKYKMNNVESKSQTEVKTTGKEANESWRRKDVDDQNHSGANTKHASNKVALKEKMKKKKKKKKQLERMKRNEDSKQKDTTITDVVDIAAFNPERLKTYGINAKKLKNKLKYGKK